MDTHRGAFEYEWRARFHLPLTVVGRSMSWGEAVRLTERLCADPSSAISAALSGWEYPATLEALALWDLYDLQHMSKSKRKPPKYPRPWGDRTRRTFGQAHMSTTDMRALLDNHRNEVPA